MTTNSDAKEMNDDNETAGNRNSGEKNKALLEKTTLALVVAVLSLLSALGGALFSADIERSMWVRNTEYQF